MASWNLTVSIEFEVDKVIPPLQSDNIKSSTLKRYSHSSIGSILRHS
jgi:hypothetical protein